MKKAPASAPFLKSVDTVIFDLDGTLLYTVEDLKEAVNVALTQYGFPTRTLAEITAFIGNGVRILMRRSAPASASDELCDEMLGVFTAYYMEHMFDHTVPYDGICELVQALHAQGYKLAIVSNKLDAATKKMNELFFAPNIDLAIGAPPEHKKPDPESVFQALRELGSEAAHAVYIGDTDVDLETANRAGLPFIGCSWGFRGHEFLQNLGVRPILDEPADLLKALAVSKALSR